MAIVIHPGQDVGGRIGDLKDSLEHGEITLVHSIHQERVLALPEGVWVGFDEEFGGRQGDVLLLLTKL